MRVISAPLFVCLYSFHYEEGGVLMYTDISR